MNIGENIKSRRLELGLTLLDVANRLGVREATVQRYEAGTIKTMKYETITALAEILETTPAALMGWKTANPVKKIYEIDGIDKVLMDGFMRLTPDQKKVLVSMVDSWLS